jgi:putative flippase GtrA
VVGTVAAWDWPDGWWRMALSRSPLVVQFLKFGVVGTIGFLVDTATVYTLRFALGLYIAGYVSYVVGASATWLLNRIWTFRGHGGGPAYHQWMRFLALNLGGFVLNRGLYSVLVTLVPLCVAQPVFAVAAGSLTGMLLNFTLSRALVFR